MRRTAVAPASDRPRRPTGAGRRGPPHRPPDGSATAPRSRAGQEGRPRRGGLPAPPGATPVPPCPPVPAPAPRRDRPQPASRSAACAALLLPCPADPALPFPPRRSGLAIRPSPAHGWSDRRGSGWSPGVTPDRAAPPPSAPTATASAAPADETCPHRPGPSRTAPPSPHRRRRHPPRPAAGPAGAAGRRRRPGLRRPGLRCPAAVAGAPDQSGGPNSSRTRAVTSSSPAATGTAASSAMSALRIIGGRGPLAPSSTRLRTGPSVTPAASA